MVGYSAFSGSLRVCWYQKNALIGFLGASASFFFLVFFSGLVESLGLADLAIIKNGLESCPNGLSDELVDHYSNCAMNGDTPRLNTVNLNESHQNSNLHLD
jgi:hypothetical protein